MVPKHVEANIQDYSPQDGHSYIFLLRIINLHEDLSNTCWAFARLQQQCDVLLLGERVSRSHGSGFD